jgi:hypothetical protein
VSAIVAKAVNDSIGTQDFKGLNTIFGEQLDKIVSSAEESNAILEEQLNKFASSMIEELPKRIADSIEGVSIPFYVGVSRTQGDEKENFITHSVLDGQVVGAGGKIGKTYIFKGCGSIRVSAESEGEGYYYLEKNGERTKIEFFSDLEKHMDIAISPNDSLSFYKGTGELKSLSISMLVFRNAGIITS